MEKRKGDNYVTIEQNVASRKEAESLFKFMLELVKDEFFQLTEHGRIAFYETAHAHFERRINQIKAGLLCKDTPKVVEPALTLREKSKFVEDAIQLLNNLIEVCETEDFPPGGQDFSESVAEGARSMLETIEERNTVTSEQERAIHNWTDGIQRWVR